MTIFWGVLGAIFAFYGIFYTVNDDIYSATPGIIGASISWILCLIFYITKRNRSLREGKVQFIKECERFGTGPLLQTQAEREKAKLIADSKNLKYTDIDSFYRNTWNEVHKEQNAADNAQAQNKLNNLKAQEVKEAHKINKYISYTGRGKRIAMLQDLAEQAEAESKRQRDVLQYAHRTASSYSTPDPFIVGGAASGAVGGGFVGAGAGFVSATQAALNRSAEHIQKSSAYQASMPALANMMFDSHANSARAKTLKEEAEKTNTALIDSSLTPDYLFSILEIYTDQVIISSTGSFKITAIVEKNTPLYVFGNIDAVICADLYQNNELKGTAYLTLPLDGIGPGAYVSGMSTDSKAETGNRYEVKYRPYHLWAIERASNDSIYRRETITIKKKEESINTNIIEKASKKELPNDQMRSKRASRYNYICNKCKREFMAKPASCPFCGADEKDIQHL